MPPHGGFTSLEKVLPLHQHLCTVFVHLSYVLGSQVMSDFHNRTTQQVQWSCRALCLGFVELPSASLCTVFEWHTLKNFKVRTLVAARYPWDLPIDVHQSPGLWAGQQKIEVLDYSATLISPLIRPKANMYKAFWRECILAWSGVIIS